MEQIVGIYKDISQFIIGILVKETDTHVVLRRALLVSVERDKNGNGLVPNFFPVTLLTLDPPFHMMGFLKEQNIDFETWYKKDTLLNPVPQELNDQVTQVYMQNFIGVLPPNASAPLPVEGKSESKSPENNIVKLF